MHLQGFDKPIQAPPDGRVRAEKVSRSSRRFENLGVQEMLPGDGFYNPLRQSPPTTTPVVKSCKGDENNLFSPLALYFRGEEFPTEKKGEKTMIGQKGWLECTEQTDYDKNKQTPQKKTRILDGIRKIAKDMVSG